MRRRPSVSAAGSTEISQSHKLVCGDAFCLIYGKWDHCIFTYTARNHSPPTNFRLLYHWVAHMILWTSYIVLLICGCKGHRCLWKISQASPHILVRTYTFQWCHTSHIGHLHEHCWCKVDTLHQFQINVHVEGHLPTALHFLLLQTTLVTADQTLQSM